MEDHLRIESRNLGRPADFVICLYDEQDSINLMRESIELRRNH